MPNIEALVAEAEQSREDRDYGRSSLKYYQVVRALIPDNEDYRDTVRYLKYLAVDNLKFILGSDFLPDVKHRSSKKLYIGIKNTSGRVINNKAERYKYLSEILKNLQMLSEDSRYYATSNYFRRKSNSYSAFSELYNCKLTRLPISIFRWVSAWLENPVFLFCSAPGSILIIAVIQSVFGGIKKTACPITGPVGFFDVLYFTACNFTFGYPSELVPVYLQSKFLAVLSSALGYIYLALIVNYFFRSKRN